MEENRSNFKIPLFDGTNFSHWKYRVGVLLDEKDFKIYIEEELEDIINRLPMNRREEARKREKKCKSILVQTIHDTQLENVKDKATVKEMFYALENMYERKSVSNQLLLRKQILTMKYNENEEMIKHFLNFDTKIRELKSTGTKLEELDVIVHLLITLPKSYDNLVTALETMDQKNLSLEFVKSRLLDEYNKRKGLGGSGGNKVSTDGATAMQANRSNIICYKCGKAGHTKFHCRSKKGKFQSGKPEEKKNQNSNSYQAKQDMYAAKIAEHEYDDDDQQILCAFEEDEDNEENALLNLNDDESFASKGDVLEMEMILDSGATGHMANKEEYFDNLQAIENVNISIAKENEKIVAKKQGNISIKTFHNGDSKSKILQKCKCKM